MNIGLTQRIFVVKNIVYDSIEHGWYRYLEGHTLFFISNNTDQDFKNLAENLDCLIITGGDDRDLRRVTEIRLATEMMKQQKPILGICHGAFMLSDILGGKIKNVTGHTDTTHLVYYNNQKITVNSFHSISITVPHVNPLVTDSDGNTEAWIDGNIAGVVWHPERMQEPWLPTEIDNLLYGIQNTNNGIVGGRQDNISK